MDSGSLLQTLHNLRQFSRIQAFAVMELAVMVMEPAVMELAEHQFSEHVLSWLVLQILAMIMTMLCCKMQSPTSAVSILITSNDTSSLS